MMHYEAMLHLKAIRKDRGLSQTELAEMVQCTQSMVSKIESGEANPTLDLIEALAKALRTSPVSLFGIPAVQQRALNALEAIPEDKREAALIVLEAMARR